MVYGRALKLLLTFRFTVEHQPLMNHVKYFGSSAFVELFAYNKALPSKSLFSIAFLFLGARFMRFSKKRVLVVSRFQVGAKVTSSSDSQ